MNRPLLILQKLKPKLKDIQWIFLAAIVLFTPAWAFSQARTITGTVLGPATNDALIGANVIVQGSTTGTLTDVNGKFSLEAATDDVLIISYIGYTAQQVTVGTANDYLIQLASGVLLEQLVVTGYGVERKKDLLGAVSVADMDAVRDVSYPNVLQQMQGRIPGVFVDQSGNPGQGTRVRIRGNTTLGNNSPLYIIDGVPLQSYESPTNSDINTIQDLSWLNPADIESMQVLKDASSASIYGSRASNGVIIITTKQAKKGRSSVSVDVRFSVENVNDRYPLATAEERAIISWQAAVNDGADPDAEGIFAYDWHFDTSLGPGIQGNGVPVLDRVIYPEWLDEDDQIRPSGHPSSVWTGTEFGGASLQAGTDWNDVIYETGIVKNYNVSVNQGGEKGGVQLGLNFFDQQGPVIEIGYHRIGIRLNSNYSFANNKVTIGQNLGVTRGERQWSDNGFGGHQQNLMLRTRPVLPVKTEDGRFSGPPGGGFDDRDNPAGLADDNRDDKVDNTKVFGNVYLDWALPIEGLSFRTNLGIDYDNIFSRDIFRTYSRGFLSNTRAELTHIQLHQTNWVWNNTLTYSKTFGQHSFTVLAGTEAIENSFNIFSITGKEFALEVEDYFQIDAASGEKTGTGTQTGFSLFSYFGKANYSFQDKYLASFTIRRDGSSRFGKANLYGVFPAASVGWRPSEEAFLQEVDWLSNLKLRVAWGRTGNQDILNDARFGLYAAIYAPQTILPWGGGCAQVVCNYAPTAYDISNQGTGLLPSGFISQQTENDELKWETQTEINVGLDFGIMDDRITGSFEYFRKKTEDILIQQTFIGTFGDGASRWANGANMETKGYEFLLGYNSRPGRDWSYSVSINGSHYDDKITALPEALWASYPGNSEQNIVGQSPQALFAYVVEGILQSPEEVVSAGQYPSIRVGNHRYADLNSDGVISALDQEYQGVNGRAGLEYGINGQVGWKNFDLALQFFGMTGRKIPGHVGFGELGGLQTGATSGPFGLDSWTYANTDTHIPAMTTGAAAPIGFSSYDIRSGNFLHFRQFTLGYTLPAAVIGDVDWLSNLRVYFSLENIKYWYTRNGSNAFRGAAWLIDNQPATPGIVGDRLGTFGSPHPKPFRASLGVSIGF